MVRVPDTLMGRTPPVVPFQAETVNVEEELMVTLVYLGTRTTWGLEEPLLV